MSDRVEDLSIAEEEQMLMGQEPAADAAPADEPQETEYLEYVGTGVVDSPEFVDRRIISRKDAKTAWDISVSKDLVWEKQPSGKNRGRMLLPVADLDPAVVEQIENEPGFKRVSLS